MVEALGGPREEVWSGGRLRGRPAHGTHRGGSKPTAATAVDQTPARRGAALTNARHRGVPVVLEKRLRGSIGSIHKPRVELTVWHPWRRQWQLGARGNTRDGEFNPFYRCACLEEGVTAVHGMGTARWWRGATANSSVGTARRAYGDGAVGWSAWRAWKRGARGEDQDGGSARAAASHGPGVRSLPRCAGPAWSRRGRCATLARQRVLDAKDRRPIKLALIDRRFLKILQQKWTKRPIGKL
jgi:hypothetical protein